jgi:hypothetical protein
MKNEREGPDSRHDPLRLMARRIIVADGKDGVESNPMAADMEDAPEAIWGELLSRQPERIRAAALGLTDEGREAVIAHLRRMASEEGWAEGQRASARAALGALGDKKGT